MTNLTEQEVCIGSLGQQKVYLNWPNVKDICTGAVSEAYEQVKKENTQLKELLKEVRDIIDREGFAFIQVDDIEKAKDLIKRINGVLDEEAS